MSPYARELAWFSLKPLMQKELPQGQFSMTRICLRRPFILQELALLRPSGPRLLKDDGPEKAPSAGSPLRDRSPGNAAFVGPIPEGARRVIRNRPAQSLKTWDSTGEATEEQLARGFDSIHHSADIRSRSCEKTIWRRTGDKGDTND